jgi:hypothetical protein
LSDGSTWLSEGSDGRDWKKLESTDRGTVILKGSDVTVLSKGPSIGVAADVPLSCEKDAEAAADVKDEEAEGRVTSGSMVVSIVSQAPVSVSFSTLILRDLSPRPLVAFTKGSDGRGGVEFREDGSDDTGLAYATGMSRALTRSNGGNSISESSRSFRLANSAELKRIIGRDTRYLKTSRLASSQRPEIAILFRSRCIRCVGRSVDLVS